MLNGALVVYGRLNPNLTGYGTTKDLAIGICVLLVSIVLFVIRRSLQDRRPLHWREMSPAVPPEGEAEAIASEYEVTA